MSRKYRKAGRLSWRRLLGGMLAACLLLLLTVAVRQGAVQDLLYEFLPRELLPARLEDQAGFSMYMLDVGQAQALVLHCGGQTAMVDTGLPGTAQEVLAALRTLGVTELDYLFVTHPHSDHCGGAKDILEQLGARVLVIPEYLSEEAALATAGDWVGNTGTQIDITAAGRQYALGEATITVLHPAANNGIEDMNDLSLVLKVAYGGKSLLLTGDITQTVEEALVPLGHIDLLQVAHHGSYTSSSGAFLEDIRPDYALISCGRNNDYGHPHDVVLERLEAVGAEIRRTDREGTLIVRIAEGEIWVETENKP